MRGLDGSYTLLTLENAQKLKAAGQEVWFQCLWTGGEQPKYRVINLRNAVNAGMKIGGYISLTSYGTSEYHINSGRNGVPDDLWDKLLLVPIDVELDGIHNANIRQAVDLLATEKYGSKRKCIYTSYSVWVNKQGNPTSFTDCLLWNAYWDGNPDFDFLSMPYGGWSIDQVVGEQYDNDVWLCDTFVDLNEFNEGLLFPQEGEDTMEKRFQQVRALQLLQAAAGNDDMCQLIRLLEYFGVLPKGTKKLKGNLTQDS